MQHQAPVYGQRCARCANCQGQAVCAVPPSVLWYKQLQAGSNTQQPLKCIHTLDMDMLDAGKLLQGAGSVLVSCKHSLHMLHVLCVLCVLCSFQLEPADLHSLIYDYLLHYGYASTLNAFEAEANMAAAAACGR